MAAPLPAVNPAMLIVTIAYCAHVACTTDRVENPHEAVFWFATLTWCIGNALWMANDFETDTPAGIPTVGHVSDVVLRCLLHGAGAVLAAGLAFELFYFAHLRHTPRFVEAAERAAVAAALLDDGGEAGAGGRSLSRNLSGNAVAFRGPAFLPNVLDVKSHVEYEGDVARAVDREGPVLVGVCRDLSGASVVSGADGGGCDGAGGAQRRRGGPDVAGWQPDRVRQPGHAALLGVQLHDLVHGRGVLGKVRGRHHGRLYVFDEEARALALPSVVGELGADDRHRASSSGSGPSTPSSTPSCRGRAARTTTTVRRSRREGAAVAAGFCRRDGKAPAGRGVRRFVRRGVRERAEARLVSVQGADERSRRCNRTNATDRCNCTSLVIFYDRASLFAGFPLLPDARRAPVLRRGAPPSPHAKSSLAIGCCPYAALHDGGIVHRKPPFGSVIRHFFRLSARVAPRYLRARAHPRRRPPSPPRPPCCPLPSTSR